jgi:hypothetical protein
MELTSGFPSSLLIWRKQERRPGTPKFQGLFQHTKRIWDRATLIYLRASLNLMRSNHNLDATIPGLDLGVSVAGCDDTSALPIHGIGRSYA